MAQAHITVERVSTLAGWNAVFRVMLDDRQVAVIPPGQTRTVDATPGDHELYVRTWRKKSSRTLHLHLGDGDEVTVRCGRPRTAAEGVLRLLRFRKLDRESVVPLEVVTSREHG
jgi:hypothetical protein